MDWAIVEVVIGLSFLFFLLSIVASAMNEAIAGVFKLRARTLERGIANLLTGSSRPARADAGIAQALYDHALVNGYGKGSDKPSYLSSRSFRNALLDVTGLLGTTTAPSGDPLPVEEVRQAVQENIDSIGNAHLQESLTAIWRSVNEDATEFRAGVERWFDRGMERVSGWYKRQTQVILFLVGLAMTIAINASAITAADRLWKDTGFRDGLVAQVEDQSESTTGAEALGKLEDLRFPIGWEASNQPHGIGGWLLAALGWLVTSLAITLGAPFWFDVLGKLSNLRSAGSKPGSAVAPAASKEVNEVTLSIAPTERTP
jgi:hypothetical protein